jgi:hypothetical protein
MRRGLNGGLLDIWDIILFLIQKNLQIVAKPHQFIYKLTLLPIPNQHIPKNLHIHTIHHIQLRESINLTILPKKCLFYTFISSSASIHECNDDKECQRRCNSYFLCRHVLDIIFIMIINDNLLSYCCKKTHMCNIVMCDTLKVSIQAQQTQQM